MLKFGEIYVKKHKFLISKEPINIKDVDIEHILVSNKNGGFERKLRLAFENFLEISLKW